MHFLRGFIESPWKPTVALGLVVLGAVAAFRFAPVAMNGVLWALLVCVIATLVVAFRQVHEHGLGRGALNGCAASLAGAVGFVLLLAVGFQRMLSDDGDPFGRDLQIPPGLVMREPRDENTPGPHDAWSKAFETECTRKRETPTTSVDVKLPVLTRVSKDRLVEFLSRSRQWHVTEERGRRYAYRRFAVDSAALKNSLHGFYSTTDCQFRVIVGFDGAAMADPWTSKATVVTSDAGVTRLAVRPSPSEGRLDSYLVVEGGELAVEIYEERTTADRSLTTLALSLVQEELQRVEEGKPPDDGIKARPGIDLLRGFQGGLYVVTAEVNAGEPGVAYLRAYEHTKNTRLSEDRLTTRSRATIGWSKNQDELFHYEADITIYEGDWGVFYPARFELWFEPASGATERKLIEDVFRIDGWQR